MNKPPRTPANFPDAKFFGADFDNTIAFTGDRVESAYEIAVEEVFGINGLETYRREGGLKNRAPVEVVRQLAPYASADETTRLLGRLDAVKLDDLTSQIGSTWPEPTKGFISFAQALEIRASDLPPVSSIIISSGHAPFIALTYKAWGIRQPDFVLAQEALSEMANRDGIALPTKPDGIIMLHAYNAWRHLHGIDRADQIDPFDIPSMIYAGDDPVKDGLLATQHNIRFKLIRPEDSAQTWQEVAFHCGLGQLALSSGHA